ncbi:carboxymethylenebutenolidase [Xylariomycetidae sp. FL0641]|nr:carboxymethylenebutenolidase [Xylariomycetidae sp. FL0641]
MASDAAPALPSAALIQLSSTTTLQPPLTRRGHGPGLIIITPGTDDSATTAVSAESAATLDPAPQKKWAEEGFAVARLAFPASGSGENVGAELRRAVEALKGLQTCDFSGLKFGLIVYGGLAEYPKDFTAERLAEALARVASEHGAAVAGGVAFSEEFEGVATLLQLAGPSPAAAAGSSRDIRKYHYASAASASFAVPGTADFDYNAAGLAHSRTLAFLKPRLGGPYFDLEAIWDEHTAYEFETRSVARTMATMVDAPYVNHVPTMTGGVGRARLTRFYAERFVFANPDDARLELVSRTVGVDRVVDEFVFACTHDRMIDWLLPGLPPTHKPLRLPFTAVVNIRGDRLYHEHILWDQATALRQLELLPEYLPFPYPVPGGTEGKTFEYRVPAAGAETAAKLADSSAVPSNGMFEGFGVREADA